MVPQTVEWVCEQDKFAQKDSSAEGAAAQLVVDSELQRRKIGPAKGIALGLLMGALCWAVIISAVLRLR